MHIRMRSSSIIYSYSYLQRTERSSARGYPSAEVPSITCTGTGEAIMVHDVAPQNTNGHSSVTRTTSNRNEHPTPAKMPKRPRAKSSSHVHADPLLSIDVLNQVKTLVIVLKILFQHDYCFSASTCKEKFQARSKSRVGSSSGRRGWTTAEPLSR